MSERTLLVRNFVWTGNFGRGEFLKKNDYYSSSYSTHKPTMCVGHFAECMRQPVLNIAIHHNAQPHRADSIHAQTLISKQLNRTTIAWYACI